MKVPFQRWCIVLHFEDQIAQTPLYAIMSRVDRETNSQKIKLQASIKNKRKQSKSVSSSALIKQLSSCPRNSSLKKKRKFKSSTPKQEYQKQMVSRSFHPYEHSKFHSEDCGEWWQSSFTIMNPERRSDFAAGGYLLILYELCQEGPEQPRPISRHLPPHSFLSYV